METDGPRTLRLRRESLARMEGRNSAPGPATLLAPVLVWNDLLLTLLTCGLLALESISSPIAWATLGLG